jgi:hypothetical protein
MMQGSGNGSRINSIERGEKCVIFQFSNGTKFGMLIELQFAPNRWGCSLFGDSLYRHSEWDGEGVVPFRTKCYTFGEFHKLLSRQTTAEHLVGQPLSK